jgi:type IV pilus assembly protein PilV
MVSEHSLQYVSVKAAQMPHYGRKQVGMTLIEVLVTLVSGSVGLLGVAALQLVSLKANQEALVRVKASSLANAMLEHIRADTAQFVDGTYDDVAFNSKGASSDGDATNLHLSTWQDAIDRELPGGAANAAGAITRIQGTNAVVIMVRWGADVGTASNRPLHQLILRSEP